MQDAVIDYAIKKGFKIVRMDNDGTCFMLKKVTHYSTRYLEVSPNGYANGEEDYKSVILYLIS